ncbi:MAG: beta-ketoacyl-ACP synthase II [Chloroflexota bacterium]|nr:beta-ketoacyl-ACP synthase II [Chloroflexota bacterium]
MTNNRVVVTGIGVINPMGLDVPSLWDATVAGKSGVDHITSFDTTGFATKIAAEVKGFDPTDYIDRKEVRRTDRFTQFAVAASLQAVENARLNIDGTNAEDIGVIMGAGFGGLGALVIQQQILTEKGPDRVSPFLIPMMIADAAAGQVSITLRAKGPNFCTTSACASGSDAIGEAYETIRRGDALAMLAGGTESQVIPLTIAAFNAARAISVRNDEPQLASRPFDAQRDGFVVGEGAAVLILEGLTFASRRGAPILAEIVGYGASADAFHVTQPAEHGEGGARAMKMALRKAGLQPEEVDYINAHGTSTPLNDVNETAAIKTVFGEHAYRIPVSSTKSMMGHLLGAAGSTEAAICVLAIQNGIVPPTTNLTFPDPDCDLDYVPNVARKAKVDVAVSNSFGFVGHNSTLVFRRYSD